MLRHYVSPFHNDWDEYLDALEFAYNNSWHQSIQTSPFKLIYGVHPKSPTEAVKLSCPTGTEVPAAKDLAEGFELAIKDAKACLAAAQSRQKQYADSKRRDVDFSIGGEVLLATQKLRLKTSSTNARKLLLKFVGPCKVLKRVNPVAYKLELPESMKIHNVFHSSLLEPYYSDGSYQPPAPTVSDDEHVEYTVERILDHGDRIFKRKIRKEYLVHWTGLRPENNTWEPEAYLANCADKLSQYWLQRSGQPTKPSAVVAKSGALGTRNQKLKKR